LGRQKEAMRMRPLALSENVTDILTCGAEMFKKGGKRLPQRERPEKASIIE
jgi:hypothetical protein